MHTESRDRSRYVRPHHLCKVTTANITYPPPRSRYLLSSPLGMTDTELVIEGEVLIIVFVLDTHLGWEIMMRSKRLSKALPSAV